MPMVAGDTCHAYGRWLGPPLKHAAYMSSDATRTYDPLIGTMAVVL